MDSGERQEAGPPRSAIYDWERELVIIFYTGGPYPASPYEIEKGSLESRSGLFGLEEVSELGVLVQKVSKGEGDDLTFEAPVFIPWGSVHLIERLKYYLKQETQEQEES